MYNVYKQPTLCMHTDVFNLLMFVCTETNVNLTSYAHLQIHLLLILRTSQKISNSKLQN